MNANRKNGGLSGSRMAGLISVVTIALRQMFTQGPVAETISSKPVPECPVGLWENADIWRRSTIR